RMAEQHNQFSEKMGKVKIPAFLHSTLKGAIIYVIWIFKSRKESGSITWWVRNAIMVLEYYDRDKLSTKIVVDYKTQSVEIENYTDDLIARAFGINENPTFADYEYFLESRCFPKTRDHLKWVLHDIGVSHYEPLAIIHKTAGRMADDAMWLKIVQE
ncbi:MAG: hypothetical protein NC355_06970, partial [Blautia sp.]|nr:hypothetical protein [Blautia sp.]